MSKLAFHYFYVSNIAQILCLGSTGEPISKFNIAMLITPGHFNCHCNSFVYLRKNCTTNLISDGYTTQKMLLKWKKGFDQSKVSFIHQIEELLYLLLVVKC